VMKCFFGRISASNKSFLGLRFFFNESMPTWSVLGEVPGFHVLHPFSSSLVALAGKRDHSSWLQLPGRETDVVTATRGLELGI